MTALVVSLPGMSIGRRVTVGAVLTLVAGGVTVAAAGAIAAMAGMSLPEGIGGALSSSADVLGWLRVIIVAAAVLTVLRSGD